MARSRRGVRLRPLEVLTTPAAGKGPEATEVTTCFFQPVRDCHSVISCQIYTFSLAWWACYALELSGLAIVIPEV